MKAALYARVSTTDQNAETQLTALRRYCEARGWKIEREFVDVASGAADCVGDRPQLQELMQPATLRKFDCLLVWKFDRLFRSVVHMMDALELFRSIPLDFVSVTECIDTTSPAGRFVYTLLAAVAEFEKDLIRERTRAGLARARAQGKRIGRARVQVDVPRALEMYARGEGKSFREIAREMNCSVSTIHRIIRQAVPKSAVAVLEHSIGKIT